MAQDFISIRVFGEDELRVIARRLDTAPAVLRRELEHKIREAARPARDAVRTAIRATPMEAVRLWPARSPRKPHLVSLGPLRRPVANAVQMEISGGADPRVEIKLDDSLVNVKRRWLARYVTGRSKRLRHPFMGHRTKWVAHPGVVDVWWPTLRPFLPRIARARDEAIAVTIRRIER